MTLNTISTLALAFATLSGVTNAHIKLSTPVPYGEATLNTSPLNNAKPGTAGSDFPCKQRTGVYELTKRTQVVAGADNPLIFDGSATHGGGSGFLAVTTDEHPDVNSQWKTFMIFDSGMPVKGDSESGSGTSSYTYALPKGMLNGNLTLGWYWYNRIGNRELYSNCAPLEISGGSDDRSVFDALPNAYLINLPTSECSSQEMGDTEIPNPGNAVVVKFGGTSSLAATGPSCAASAAAVTKGVSGGSGSGPATSAASPTSAPVSSAPASYGGSPPSNMTSAAASPVSSSNGGEIGSSAPGSASATFLTVSTAASSPADSSAYPTMTPSSAGIAAPTGYPAAATGSSSSGSSSGDGITCSSDAKQYGQEVAGSMVWRNVAAGTSCQNGQIVKRSLMRTFSFFRHETVQCVSGYFHDPLWDRLVLQCYESEPAVRHAINAVGALHEERFLGISTTKDGGDVSKVRTSFPVMQYGKALQELQSILRGENVSVDLIMVCILLMVHFESLRECFVPALVHVENAIRLLHSSASFDARKIDQNLLRALMRLDIQGALYLATRVPGLAFYTAALDSTLPVALHDLTQARDILNTWISRLLHFVRVYADEYKLREPGAAPLEDIARSHELVHMVTTIDQLLWDFMHRPGLKLSTREQHGLAVLRSRAKCNRIVAACCIYAEATMYDAYLPEFEEILSICAYIMGSDKADRRLFSVSLDEGLLHPLHFVATHCRDSRIRRSALAHLQRLPKTAGIWHVESMTRTAEMCVDFEETWCGQPSPVCQDIPEWGRIHTSGFHGWDLQGVRPTVTALFKLRPNGMDGEWMSISKEIEWRTSVQSDVDQLSDSLRMLTTIEHSKEHWTPSKESDKERKGFTAGSAATCAVPQPSGH
ncbi:hypothetical protein B0A55_02922 [Friedmanniomyces simplex]|uniref:Uncharacterized protein n=1 Tax=Friedmanniomyces simplex TaxID=329884 RepID=A0A4U0XZJ5_9PEZI|nr:hypothetical protein B0A55_02922 [Friedmanniomyces simplex]